MARQNLENLVTYLEQRTKINANFTELYAEVTSLNAFDFSTFGITGVTELRHVGEDLTGNQTFTWSTSNDARVTTDSIDIRDVTGSADLATGLTNDGTEILTLSTIDFDTLKTQTFRVSGTDILNSFIVTKDLNIKSAYYFWYGLSTNATLNASQIISLPFVLRDGTDGSFTIPSFSVPSYLYICYDSSFDDLLNIDLNSINMLGGFQKLSNVTIIENGISHDVKVYRSNNLLTTDIIASVITTG